MAAVAGCAPSDPRIVGGPPKAPTGSASPPGRTPAGQPAPPRPAPTFAGAAAGARLEEQLAGAVAGVLSAFGKRLGDRRDLLGATRDIHLAHAAALLGPNPSGRDTTAGTPRPRAVPPRSSDSLTEALDRLARAETAAAAAHRRSALAAVGSSALLWGSLAVTASTLATAVTAEDAVPVAAVRPPRDVSPLPDLQAVQQVVAQLHAVVYGYQLAIGQLKVSSAGHDRAVGRLRSHRRLRDDLIQQLLDRSADVPVAAPAYVPSVNPTTPSRAGRLIQQMETAFSPFCGQWLAAAGDPTQRGLAYSALAGAIATARTWGAAVPRWPGWPA